MGTICWGHDTSIMEQIARDFNIDWSGTGNVTGSGDDEVMNMEIGQTMTSITWNLGIMTAQVARDTYKTGTGEPVTISYKTGDTEKKCNEEDWHVYDGISFISLGWVKIKVDA